jgi:hypothetical protein
MREKPFVRGSSKFDAGKKLRLLGSYPEGVASNGSS